MSELKNFENLPIGYDEIVNLKNTNISNVEPIILSQIDIIREIIFENRDYENLINSNDFLNQP